MTLALQVPATGAGLRYWNPKKDGSLKAADLGIYCEQTYVTGHLYCFAGNLCHQIAPNPDMKENDPRITLQAHSVYHRDGYRIIYW